MKNFTQFLVLVAMLFTTNLSANDIGVLQGNWLNQKNNILIEVENYSDGIKVRRADQNNWYFYRRQRSGSYKDDRGHSYVIVNDREMIYKSRNGGLVLYYNRVVNERQREVYVDRWYDRLPRVEGTWYNGRNGDRARITEREDGLLVKYRNEKIFFEYDGFDSFVDRQGNAFTISRNGSLSWTDRRNRSKVRFYRSQQRRRNYCD